MILKMAELHLTRDYLNSLSNAELLDLADGHGLDTHHEADTLHDPSSGFDRFFLIDELLESVSSEMEEPVTEDVVLVESVPLPKQYNITFIEVMIRDPFWAFVFWEIKSSDKEQFESANDFDGYYLKVSPLKNQTSESQAEGVFTVPVKNNDTARYLGLTPDETGSSFQSDDRWYKVEFCAGHKGNETVIAVSNPVRLPGLTQFASGAEKPNCKLSGNRLISMSGYEDFRIIRRNERLHRIKSYE